MIEGKFEEKMDLVALRGALERRDVDALLGFYATDAELRVLNAASPDGPAFELRGRADIQRYLRVVFVEKTASRIEVEEDTRERFAFSEMCEYQDGTQVLVRTMLEFGEGGIVSHVDLVRQSPEPHQRSEGL